MSCLREQDPEKTKNLAIGMKIKKEFGEERKLVKLLLLGAGASGKSTIFKQMKIIHAKGYTDKEREDFKTAIHNNVCDIFTSVIDEASKLTDCKIDQKHNNIIKHVMKYKRCIDTFELNSKFGKELADLWGDDAVKKTLLKKSEFDIIDSADYFVEHLERISKEDYIPNVTDILMSRTKTVGIVQQKFSTDKMKILMVDVGGQRNERRKWIHAFDSVTSVIFITSLSEYDQKLEEDRSENRMQESLNLFDTVFNSKGFLNKAIIVFYNKDDIFKQKIKTKDLSCCFKEYKGGTDYKNALDFIQKKFSDLNKNRERKIYEHVTTATNTENVKLVFEFCSNIILRQLMKQQGIL